MLAVIQNLSEQSWMITEYVLAVVTGYLLIAFFVGARLSRFQVSVVNGLYVLMHFLGIWSAAQAQMRAAHYIERLVEVNPDTPTMLSMTETGVMSNATMSYAMGFLIMAACLTFMWSVRNPSMWGQLAPSDKEREGE